MIVQSGELARAREDELTTPVLLHPTSEGWSPLPEWCSFFRRLGQAVAGYDDPATRLIAGVTVPVRAYAASFAALGAIDARLLASGEVAADEHFGKLAHLTPGDSVTVVEVGRKYKAKFVDVGEVSGRRGIWIERVNDHMKQFMPEQVCDRVQIGNTGKDRAPKRPDLQRRKGVDPFAAIALGLSDPRSFAHRDDYSSLIIGRLKTLRLEMTTFQRLSVSDGEMRSPVEGTLASLLRPRPFLNEDECYRTDIVADVRAERAAELSLVPPVVIFDGPRGFLRHRASWRSSSWIVILDATASSFNDGVAALNDDYIQRRLDGPDPLPDIEPPAGLELCVFAEARR